MSEVSAWQTIPTKHHIHTLNCSNIIYNKNNNEKERKRKKGEKSKQTNIKLKTTTTNRMRADQ